MKYLDFIKNFQLMPFFSLSDVRNIFSEVDNRRIYEWHKKGYLNKLSGGFYAFKNRQFTERELCLLANKLYQPSYLSLEYVLSKYNLIPEIVYWRTSVTTKKTKNITNPLGNFSYRTVKRDLFWGYSLATIGGAAFIQADPEKALLDLLYLRADLDSEAALDELRINPQSYREKINQKKLAKYCKNFNSPNLERKINLLNKLMSQND